MQHCIKKDKIIFAKLLTWQNKKVFMYHGEWYVGARVTFEDRDSFVWTYDSIYDWAVNGFTPHSAQHLRSIYEELL